jgi:hypothetical protein
LEFDISFLLDVRFYPSATRRQKRIVCAQLAFPVIANAGSALSTDSVWPSMANYGIWYARNEVVKVLQGIEALKIRVT